MNNSYSSFEDSIHNLFESVSLGLSALLKPVLETRKAKKVANVLVSESLENLFESQEKLLDGITSCLESMPEGMWTLESLENVEGSLRQLFTENLFSSIVIPEFETDAAKKAFIRQTISPLIDFQIMGLHTLKNQIRLDSKDQLDVDTIRFARSLGKTISFMMELSFDMSELIKKKNPLTKSFQKQISHQFGSYLLIYLRLIDVLKSYVDKSSELNSKLKYLSKERINSKGVLLE